MVIRFPIFQVGWFSACSTVIEANSDFGVLKKGPPEAVSQMRSTSSGAPAAHALMDGVMFAVDGEQRLALLAGLGGDQFAGGDQAFLVGKAESLSGRTAS